MANICCFDLRAYGEHDTLMELYELLDSNGRYKGDGVGKIYEFDWAKTGDNFADGVGSCAWAVQTAMLDTPQRPLENELKRLGLTVEIYSSEPGVGFQEHYVFYKGQKIVDECKDGYFEADIEDYDEKELEDMAARFDITLEELQENTCDGFFMIGGFNGWSWSTLEEIEQMADALGIAA